MDNEEEDNEVNDKLPLKLFEEYISDDELKEIKDIDVKISEGAKEEFQQVIEKLLDHQNEGRSR